MEAVEERTDQHIADTLTYALGKILAGEHNEAVDVLGRMRDALEANDPDVVIVDGVIMWSRRVCMNIPSS